MVRMKYNCHTPINTKQLEKTLLFIYGIHIFLSIDWLKVHHVIKNKLTIVKKLGQSRK